VKGPLPPVYIYIYIYIYATHIDFSPTLSVTINICYILLVEDVRRMGEYCIRVSSQTRMRVHSWWWYSTESQERPSDHVLFLIDR
jgi:hypothetical protein